MATMRTVKTYQVFLESLKLQDIFTDGYNIADKILSQRFTGITPYANKEYGLDLPRYIIHKVIGSIRNVAEESKYTPENWQKILNELESKCGSFLNELKTKKSLPVFRGVRSKEKTNIKNLFYKKSIKNRVPKDTPHEIQDSLDQLFLQYFDIEPRSNGVFTTKNYGVAEGYSTDYSGEELSGGTYIFFPIGNYKYIWNPRFDDLFSEIESIGEEFPEEFDEFYMGETDIPVFKDIIIGYKMNSIELAESQEITFLCDDYYLVDVNYLAPLLIHLGIL